MERERVRERERHVLPASGVFCNLDVFVCERETERVREGVCV